METTTPIGHPRRLFANVTPAKVTETAPARPTGGSPLLAPRSMNLATHIEISTLELDLAVLMNFVAKLGATGESLVCESVFLPALAPLREALVNLQFRIGKSAILSDSPHTDVEAHMNELKARVEALDEINVLTDETTQLVSTPTRTLTRRPTEGDPKILSDMEHLRTIQKEVRSLFASVNSPSPIKSSSLSGFVARYPSSACTETGSLQTATKISRVLAASPDKTSTFSQLTLSPTTELFERDSVRLNPWFERDRRKKVLARRRSGSLPPPMSPGSTLPDFSASNVVSNREIPNENDSQTILALQAAMAARRRAPSVGAIHRIKRETGTSDLVSWLRKQASNSKGLDKAEKAERVFEKGNSSRRMFDSALYRN